jgi:glycosyltransferase involved in cell wall biosynthesis
MVFAAVAPKLGGRGVLLDVHDLSTEVFASRHGEAPTPVRIAERLALRFADHVVTVHDHYRDLVSERGVDRDDISVVVNTPDDRRFPLRPPPIPSRSPRLIFHGTLVARFGLAPALHALAAVRDRVPGASLQLVGEGDFRPEIVRLVSELGLEGRVDLSPGLVPVDQIPACLAAADVGLAPFLDDRFTRTTLPTKLLEYVRLGLPVIVSRNPVIERYFTDDDVFFVQPGNADEIAAAIERIADDPAGAARRARRAQRFFDIEGWPEMKKRFLAIVDQMTAR